MVMPGPVTEAASLSGLRVRRGTIPCTAHESRSISAAAPKRDARTKPQWATAAIRANIIAAPERPGCIKAEAAQPEGRRRRAQLTASQVPEVLAQVRAHTRGPVVAMGCAQGGGRLAT